MIVFLSRAGQASGLIALAVTLVTLSAPVAIADPSSPPPTGTEEGTVAKEAPAQLPPVVKPAPPPVSAGPSRKVVALVAGGLAVVGVGLGTGFGVAALNDKSSFDRSPTLSKANDGNDLALASDVAFGAAVACAVTSLVLYLTDPPTDATGAAGAAHETGAAARISASPLVALHGGGASVLVSF